MPVDWVLLVLLFPFAEDGLVTGWYRHYPTQQACEVARADAVRRSEAYGRSRTHVMAIQCAKKN